MAVVTRAPTAEAFAIRDQVSQVIAISFGLLLTLLIGTAAVSMRSVTVDVNRLSKKARRISEGSFDVDMSHHRIDEIGTLYQSVGEMRDSLRTRIEQAERREQEMTQAREETEQARKKLRQIIDLVPDLIFAKNQGGEYLIANEATAEAYGLSPEEVEGRNESEVIPSVEDSEGFREDDLAVIESGESKFIPDEEITTADGETRILQTTKIPYDVPGSDEDAVLGYSRDVTELKRYEQTLETQRDNLQVLNQVVRHDIRNKLQLVSAYAQMCQEQLEDGSEENVENVLEATRDAIDITETARDVTEVMLQSEVDRSPVGLRNVLEEEIDDIRSGFDTVRITVEGSIPDVDVIADDMLESMFRNLLHNAVQHNDKDVPEIAVSARLTNDHVVVRIADNGPGIPDGQKELIFQEGKVGIDSDGTGLGLYLVDTLVDRYGGDVRVKDNEPTGSVFIVTLLISR
ncbi:signal-transducing histidine kinase [Halanaeroarchaeum sulfurireducens]|uniref:histidine kinase n=2 Tax=Halanaeroarchaeum sulfurireducens TaxID=1604004 RepID=A0A0F7PDH3_9EURY|nr:signal-transducing histidine kinase [Halanaeroarchaeum sulfurireducens]ALG82634.1 signal-transducing histidine kinase [Halanaeroarchaeum sulfurireducens]